MEEIKVMEKPDWVSWDDIHELLLEAHKKNIEKGLIMGYAQMPGEKIKQKLGDEGCCWVALDGDKLVGTTSVTYFTGKSWWNYKKKVAHGCFTGIIKEYQGIGIMEEFNEKFRAHIKSMGADVIDGDTAENNHIMLKVMKNNGFKSVSYYAPNPNHYSIRLTKWVNGCPYSDKYIERRFKIAKMLTHWQYKPGKVERSLFISFFCRAMKKILRIK